MSLFNFFQRRGKHVAGKSHGAQPRTRPPRRGATDGQRLVPRDPTECLPFEERAAKGHWLSPNERRRVLRAKGKPGKLSKRRRQDVTKSRRKC